jgi:hypothetical protein
MHFTVSFRPTSIVPRIPVFGLRPTLRFAQGRLYKCNNFFPVAVSIPKA